MSVDAPERPTQASSPRRWTSALRRRRVLVPVVAGAVVLVLFVIWLVAFSSAFGVRTVQVRGAHTLTAAEVEGRADISMGTPLVRVDTDAIASRVETLADVASAEVSTSFPSTLTITVVERTPVGYVREGGVYELVDHTGAAYRGVSARPHGLPTMVVPTDGSGAATRRAVARVVVALDALPPAARPRIVSIQALAPNAITLVLTHDRVVHWGTASSSEDKARVLPIMLRKRSAERFDVSNPDRPFSS